MVLIKNTNSLEAFQMREIDDPIIESDEVGIDVETSGLNFADVMARQGHYRDAPPLPSVIGYEVVGKIYQVGADVVDLKVGDRVVAFTRFGGYAKKAKVSFRGAVKIPDAASSAESCALATQFTTAYYCIEEAMRVHKGDKILIQAAAGGVGIGLVQLATHHGLEIWGTAGGEKKCEFIKELGVHHAIDYKKYDFKEYIESRWGARPLDIVIDSLGGVAFKKGYSLLSICGKIIGLGASSMSGSKFNIFRTVKEGLGFGLYHPAQLLMASQSMIGVNMLQVSDHKQNVLERCLKGVVDYYEKGILRPHVGGEFSIEELPKAHDYLGQRKSMGKVVVHWQ